MHDIMALKFGPAFLSQVLRPSTGQDDVRMGLGHGSFGQELWLGFFLRR